MTLNPKTQDPIQLRLGTLADAPKISLVARKGYDGTPLEEFLSPRRHTYPEDAQRAWTQKATMRWLNARVLTFIAYPASTPDTVIGYAIFERLGIDEAAKRQMASRKTFWLAILLWYYTYKFKIVNYIWPDRSTNSEALKVFMSWGEEDEKRHWKSFPDRHNRWHVRSCVVDPDWQGRGIGSMLMNEVIVRAKEEGVVVGLEATAHGEHLYKKFGFEVLSRFSAQVQSAVDPNDGGGIMMWRPKRLET